MNKAGFATVNPSTGEEIEVFSYFTPAQTEKVVARVDKSFQSFGPVAALTRVPDIDAAVRAANASQFGLSGNLWTRDVELARKVARDLYTGGVFINGVTATDPRVPVGGVKNSGYGRELSHFGAHAFVNAQTVWIENA